MGNHFFIAGGPYLEQLVPIFLVLFGCPILALTFFSAAVLLFAQKERKAAKICGVVGLLFALVSLAFWYLLLSAS